MPDIPQPDSINKPFRILALDGGGAKGFYTLGLLDEIERNMGQAPSYLLRSYLWDEHRRYHCGACCTRG